MDDGVPLQYDMALAVRRGDRTLQKQLEQVMRDKRDALRKVLDDFGVPLVQCEGCIISGELPSHGPYSEKPEPPPPKPEPPPLSPEPPDDSTLTPRNPVAPMWMEDDDFPASISLAMERAVVMGME